MVRPPRLLSARHHGPLVELAAATSIEEVYATLRAALHAYGVASFTIHTLEGDAASLAFSCGLDAPLEGDERSTIAVDPRILSTLMEGRALFVIPDVDGRTANLEGRPEWQSALAAIFRMSVERKTIGCLSIHGIDAAELFPHIQGLTELTAVFSVSFDRIRMIDGLQRAHQRADSRLRELQEGRAVLLLSDETEILDHILKRSLHLLASEFGMVWQRSQGAWNIAHRLGAASTTVLTDVAGLLERCLRTKTPRLISSLTSEEVDIFDEDSIHLASAVAFPLRIDSSSPSCLLVVDATVSRDIVHAVEGATLIGATAIENLVNKRHLLEQQRLREQLALAANVQKRLLPKRMSIPGLAVTYFSQYCEDTGGDYVDYIPDPERRRWTFVVGDVSGHGLPAAMLMVEARACVRAYLNAHPDAAPDVVLKEVNRIIYEESSDEEFITLIVCCIDTRSGFLWYASAGHEPPLIYRSSTEQWFELASTGVPLGLVDDATYGCERFVLTVGDLLVVATDGATEAENASGVAFGSSGIKSAVASSAYMSVDSVMESLVRQTLTHRGRNDLIDDVTYLMVKVENLVLQKGELPPQIRGERIYSGAFRSTIAEKESEVGAIARLLSGHVTGQNASSVFMAIEEALTNAVLHGNKRDAQKQVSVELWMEAGVALYVTVADQGMGFELQSVRAQEEDALLMESGRGLLMMVSLMDEVIYWNGGRNVCMIKRLAAHADEAS